MIVLGLESSCDETAAALVDGDRRILADEILSQLDDHRPYGGIVPEIAARAHLDHMDGIVARALDRAGVGLAEIDGVAATGGPGLIGGVMVGMMTAKAIAFAAGKPLIAVNHLEGHALTARLTDGLDFPYLLLLVSGGHCQLLIVEGVGRYVRLGTTIDDAVGEAFDKAAKLLGLGYPGGPEIERAAAAGDPARFDLPRPMKGRPGCDFSFSGLKTALRRTRETLPAPGLNDAARADLAAGFQAAVCESLADRVRRAMEIMEGSDLARHLVVAGGVAANRSIHAALAELTRTRGYSLHVPPLELCTDNGAMIAWAGAERLAADLAGSGEIEARARWPLDADAAPALGSGRHGAKA